MNKVFNILAAFLFLYFHLPANSFRPRFESFIIEQFPRSAGFCRRHISFPDNKTEDLQKSIAKTPVISQYYNRLKLFTDEQEEKNKKNIEELKNILLLISQQS